MSEDTLIDEGDCYLGDSFASAAAAETVQVTTTVAPLSSIECAERGAYFLLAVNIGSSDVLVLDSQLVVWPAIGSYICSGVGELGVIHDHIDSYFNGTAYELRDLTRRANNDIHGHHGQMPANAGIATRQGSMWWSAAQQRLYDTLCVWEGQIKNVGADAQVYAGILYDYLWHHLGQAQIDNGQSIAYGWLIQNVENPDCHNNAAYRTLSCKVNYGTHDSLMIASYGSCINVVAHEWGHGVTEFNSGLSYQAESGALNESFSDVIGVAVGFWSGVDSDWQAGEECAPWYRDLQNPPSRIYSVTGEPYPDTYHGPGWYYGADDNGGVHVNSSVGNKMFYLLSDGGTHNGVTVTGIGIQNAMMVMYRANRDFWVASTDFANARDGCISAAYAVDSSYVPSVMDAWAAVGVGLPYNHVPDPVDDLVIIATATEPSICLFWSPAPYAWSYDVHAGDNPSFVADSTSLIGVTADTSFVESRADTTNRRFYTIIASSMP